MARLSLLFAAFMITFCAFAQERKASDDTNNRVRTDSDIEKQVREILAARMPKDIAYLRKDKSSYRSLFDLVGIEGVHKLQMHPNDGVAIQAAWEEVALTVPDFNTGPAGRPDPQKLNWFVGFVEGRTHIRPPDWWRDSVISSGANSRRNIYPGQAIKQPYHDAGLGGCKAPVNTTLKKVGDKLVLQVEAESIGLPEGLFVNNDPGRSLECASAVFTPSRCYVAVHDDIGNPYELTCLSRATGQAVWKAKVWGSWWFGATGKHEMWVSVIEQDKRVFVFGSASTGIHVEVFRAEDGTNLSRFSSSY